MSKNTDAQITDLILMVRPAKFGFNTETANSNVFQKSDRQNSNLIQQKALKEFDELVKKLREKNIYLMVLQDDGSTTTPDSIFPNNWISFHDNKIILYPMLASNRRLERKPEWIAFLKNNLGNLTNGSRGKTIFDLSNEELKGNFLEGTGSLVLDRKNKIAYANLSSRTNKFLLEQWCNEMNFEPVLFNANTKTGEEIYHTNVLMAIGETAVVICSEVIRNEAERKMVLEKLARCHQVVKITESQMMHFAGNMLLIKNRDAKNYWVLSTNAFESLTEEQKNILKKDGEFLYSDLTTIETIGGGSARCMMAEVF